MANTGLTRAEILTMIFLDSNEKMKALYQALIATICFVSCSTRQDYVYINPDKLYDEVMWVDSTNNKIVQALIDSIPEIINPETDLPYSKQDIKDAWAKASQDWLRFVKLIRRHQYKKASVFIMDADNRGSILGHIRESELRTVFIQGVVCNLLMEYQIDHYYQEYLDWLYEEVLIETTYNGLLDDLPHDVAGTYLGLLVDYGITLVSAGFLEDALELVPLYYKANLYFYPDDDLWALYTKVHYENTIYHMAGDVVTADSILNDFKNNVIPLYGERGKDALKDVEEIEAYWAAQE